MGITIKQLATELSLSPSTISRALRDDRTISQQTKDKVLKLARKMNYQPNPFALMLRKQSSRIITVLVPTLESHYFSQVVSGIELEAQLHGYGVIVGQTHDQQKQEKMLLESPLIRQSEGVIVAFAKDTTSFSHFEMLQEMNMPLVFFDRMCEELHASTVISDDYSGAWDSVMHLAEQGYQKIAFIGTEDQLAFNQAREDGFMDALDSVGLTYHTARNRKCKVSTINEGRKVASELLSLPKSIRPDAIFASCDLLALGAMQVAQEKKIQIPKALGIVGFGNAPFTAWLHPTLTSVRQPSKIAGKIAVDFLLQQLDARASKKAFETKVKIVDTNLIIRNSSLRNKMG